MKLAIGHKAHDVSASDLRGNSIMIEAHGMPIAASHRAIGMIPLKRELINLSCRNSASHTNTSRLTTSSFPTDPSVKDDPYLLFSSQQRLNCRKRGNQSW